MSAGGPDRFALVIGAMKCGTTGIFAALAQHPQIAACREKEPEFFNHDERWRRGTDWYRGLWDWRSPPHRWALEASANYSKRHLFPATVDRIASMDRTCRFIYVLRDPIERIEAHYRHRVIKNGDGPPSATPDRVAPGLIETSRYAAHAMDYVRRFGRDALLLVSFEQWRDDPVAALDAICRFLEIDTGFAFRDLDVRHNPGRTDHPAYTALARRRWLLPLARLTPARWRRRLRNRLGRALDVDTRLSPAQRELARTALADDLRALRDDLGFDTSGWR